MPDIVSVIVPVYNVWPYLSQCVESICHQTYTELEIILVDDGSDDGSGHLCEELALADSRLKVIHTPNSGLSAARNTGIGQSGGEFVVCVDSDDVIHPQMIEKLYHAIIQNNADISFCSYQYIAQDESPVFALYDSVSSILLSGQDCIEKMYSSLTAVDMVVAWNKMYKRTYFQDLKYPINRKHEDEFLTYKILYPLKKCVYIKNPLYYYRIRKNSITQQKDIARSLDIVDALNERLNFFNEKKEKKLYILTLKKYMDALILAILSFDELALSEDIRRNELNQLLRKTFCEKVLFSSLKTAYKIKYIVFMFNNKLYAIIQEKRPKKL